MGNDLWRVQSPTFTHDLTTCTQWLLSSGVVVMPSATATITGTATFSPFCAVATATASSASYGSKLEDSRVAAEADLHIPFYATVAPIAISMSVSLTVAWILFLMLFITPGRRPYLQKFAALTVAVSLTYALSRCVSIIQEQFYQEYTDAEEIRTKVGRGTALLVLRGFSDVFMWLAQIQTLVRLFPRHREKRVIRGIGGVLIIIDSVFWILQACLNNEDDDQSFKDAIPALSYLFQIIIALIYSAYVIYYSIAKRPFAYHSSNLILALISVVSVLSPVMFFLLDVSHEYIIGWGTYIYWVGSVAASVVVWEWVDRIELLERKFQESGVLGRQVFEDELVETGAHKHRKYPFARGKGGKGGKGGRPSSAYYGDPVYEKAAAAAALVDAANALESRPWYSRLWLFDDSDSEAESDDGHDLERARRSHSTGSTGSSTAATATGVERPSDSEPEAPPRTAADRVRHYYPAKRVVSRPLYTARNLVRPAATLTVRPPSSDGSESDDDVRLVINTSGDMNNVTRFRTLPRVVGAVPASLALPTPPPSERHNSVQGAPGTPDLPDGPDPIDRVRAVPADLGYTGDAARSGPDAPNTPNEPGPDPNGGHSVGLDADAAAGPSALPPFEPHPGFSHDDYWDEKAPPPATHTHEPAEPAPPDTLADARDPMHRSRGRVIRDRLAGVRTWDYDVDAP
ncbi:PalH/RIM21-domain-containing protein [Dipodascopsis tothii]|uniref:PalH/RIM21-domain-containing protein n=1 Tax=Dipodascopsis tothii TaxID=44089 RepID=UPI0034CEDA59